MIVDFRYKTTISPDIVRAMVGAIRKIARHNHLGLIISTLGDKTAIKQLSGLLTIKKNADLCLSKKMQKDPEAIISVTPADSDNDYLS